MKKIENVKYGDNSSQTLDIYLPKGSADSVFVYFHGGGLESGDKNDAEIFAPYLTKHGVVLISANYRMYPEAEYPNFISDAAKAVSFSHKYMCENLHCDKLYVGGSSAGGYISMMLCFDRRHLASEGIDNTMIQGYFHDAGQPTAHFNVLKARGIDPRRTIIDESAPLFYIGLEEKYPPMRFIVSDNDISNRYEQIMLTLSTLSHFGISNFDHVVMHGNHCEYCSKTDEDGNGLLGKMIFDFLKKCC